MQTTFFIECGFWIEGLGARYYEDHMGRKGIEDRMNMTLWNLKTYK